MSKRAALSWFVIALGILLGLSGLVLSSKTWIPDDLYSLQSYRDWVGQGLFGLVFLIGSLIALRNRRRAGLSFLVSAPIVAFCGAFPEAVLSVPDPHGAYMRWPIPPTALALEFLFFFPFFALLLAMRNRKRALFLFLLWAPLAGLVFGTSEWTPVLLPSLAAWSALCLVFGSFWLGTYRLDWPPLVAARPGPLTKRLAMVSLGCLLVAILDCAATLTLVARESSLWQPDCSGAGLFVRPRAPGHAVFTARAIRVGHSVRVSGQWAGKWAIGLVQDRFWGVPSWAPHFVLLTNGVFQEGEAYFIDGWHDQRLLTRFLPVVSAGPCTRSRPLADASIELRLLREAPSEGEVRIVGHVRKPANPAAELKPPAPHALPAISVTESSGATMDNADRELTERVSRRPAIGAPFAGVRISVTGSSRTTIVATDREGIYEVAGLPPDNYTLKLIDLPDTQYAVDRDVEKEWLKRSGLIEVDFRVDWKEP